MLRKSLILLFTLCLTVALGQPFALGEAAPPEATQTQEWVESQENISETERFTILRDGDRHALVYSRLENGGWKQVWRNDALLPDTMRDMYLCFYPAVGTQPHEYPRFTVTRGDTLAIYAGEEHPDLSVSLSRTAADTWQVDNYSWNDGGLYAYLFPDCVLVNANDLSALQTAGISFTQPELNAAFFNPRVIQEAGQALEERMRGAPNIDFFANAEALYLCLERDVLCPVHVSPSASSPRAAGGKAVVSLMDWVVALCREGDWLMVLYETRPGSYRAGWVDSTQDDLLARVCSLTMPACFTQNATARLNAATALWDDPLSHSGEVCALPAGTRLTVLWENGLSWSRGERWDEDAPAYVQAVNDGQTWRGFVPRDRLALP